MAGAAIGAGLYLLYRKKKKERDDKVESLRKSAGNILDKFSMSEGGSNKEIITDQLEKMRQARKDRGLDDN